MLSTTWNPVTIRRPLYRSLPPVSFGLVTCPRLPRYESVREPFRRQTFRVQKTNARDKMASHPSIVFPFPSDLPPLELKNLLRIKSSRSDDLLSHPVVRCLSFRELHSCQLSTVYDSTFGLPCPWPSTSFIQCPVEGTSMNNWY